METIKKIGVSDLNKLGIILNQDFINNYSIREGDRIDIDDFLLIEGVKK
jgi:putative ubiquitin-RnfH superfamily antitoxin RatB of RatAB toxin-antitoxin module